jgi:hypothetical protein
MSPRRQEAFRASLAMVCFNSPEGSVNHESPSLEKRGKPLSFSAPSFDRVGSNDRGCENKERLEVRTGRSGRVLMMCVQGREESSDLDCDKLLPGASGVDPGHESLELARIAETVTAVDGDA